LRATKPSTTGEKLQDKDAPLEVCGSPPLGYSYFQSDVQKSDITLLEEISDTMNRKNDIL
jgi:hypothetical protein